jgi:hypothetical protein
MPKERETDFQTDILIPIQFPFSLDKTWCEFDDEKPSGLFTEMHNYIPEGYVMRTRKGITSLVFTPQATGAPPTPPPFPTTDTRCRMVLDFEATDVTLSALGTNTKDDATAVLPFAHMKGPNYSGTATYNTYDPTSFKQGAASLWLEDDTATNTSTGNPALMYGLIMFPNTATGTNWQIGENPWIAGAGSNAQTMLITMWIKPKAITSPNHNIFLFGDDGSQYSAYMRHTWSSPNTLMHYAHYDNLGGSSPKQLVNVVVEDEWQFVAGWTDFKTGNVGFYHYNDQVHYPIYTASTVGIVGRWFRENGGRLVIGGGASQYNAGAGGRVVISDKYRGYIDYVTYWDSLPTTNSGIISLVEQIRDLHKTPGTRTNDFSLDSNCIGWYKMESYAGNTVVDEIAGSNATGSSTGNSAYITQDTTNKIAYGLSASLSLDNLPTVNSAVFTVPYASQATKFPGNVGVGTTFSMTGWIRWTGTTGTFAQGIASMWDSATDRSYLFYLFSSSFTFRLLVRDTTDANLDILTAYTPTVGNWYHFKCTFSSADLTARLRICDSSGVTVASGNATTGNDMRTYNQTGFQFCTFNYDSTRAWDGNIQEFCIFNDYVTHAEQDQMIKGIYRG